MRAAISLFGDFVRDRRTERLKGELKWITSAFGPAREMDVLVARAADTSHLSPSSDSGEEIGQPALRQELEQKRRRAFRRAQVAVASTRFRLLLIDLTEWIEAGEWFTPGDPLLELQGKRPVAQFAVEELERRWKKALKRGRKLRELDPLRRHKLRIQVKKMRYATEFFGGAFPRRKAERRRKVFLGALEPLQDCLGDLNDITVDLKLTAKLATQQKRPPPDIRKTAFAAGELAGREETRLEAVLAAAETSFDHFARAKPFW